MAEGSRWVGDQEPNALSELEHASSLPPKITDKYVFFFGWEGSHPQVCLQQWYSSPFYDPEASGGYDDDDENVIDREPLRFHTTEQYMMYWKALLMGDDEIALKILDCKTPAEAKALGREVSSIVAMPIWLSLNFLSPIVTKWRCRARNKAKTSIYFSRKSRVPRTTQ